MRFMHRYRRILSVVSVLTFVLAGSVTPASAIYNPKTGKWMQRDPNGLGIVLQPGLSYQASNPIVTVSMAYELQYGDGMNFYEYLRSNSITGRDPSGLFSLSDTLTTQTLRSYLRSTGLLAGVGVAGAGLFGGIRSGYQAQLNGATARDIAIAAVTGAGHSGYKAFARVLIASAIIATGPGGLALAGSVGVFESANAYGDARERQERARTEGELSLATFDSIFASIGIAGSLYGTSLGIRGAAIAARASLPPLPRGNSGVWEGTFKGARFRADVVRSGTELQLNNVGIEGAIGQGGFKALVDSARHVARAEGFSRLRIFAVRESGKNPFRVIDRVYNLD